MSIVTGRLDHVAIAAADVEAMVQWYQRVLELKVVERAGPNAPQRQRVYLIGPGGLGDGMMIEVMPRNETPRHERNSHEPGLSHVAWCVADFDAALAHLQSQRVEFLGGIVQAVGGGRLISFADCEGNMMQIVERKGV